MRALVADVAIISYTMVAGTLAVASALVTRSGRYIHPLERIWAKLIVRAAGMQIEVEGLGHVEAGRSYVIVSNHQSHLDICATIHGLDRQILFVAKSELLSVPIFGQALRVSDHIVIDRGDSQKAIETVNSAVARARPGSCVLFYAEGTRSSDGNIQPFKKGGVTLALRTGLPVLPLTVSGTRKLLPKGARLVRPGGKVRLVIAPPIETAGLGMDARDALNQRVREIVVENFVADA